MIRAASSKDASRVAEILNHEITQTAVTFNATPVSGSAMAEKIAAAGPAFLVLQEAGRVTGYASYTQFRGGVGYAHCMEHSIHLDQTARGKGQGRALFSAIEAQARRANVVMFIAGISGENPAGVAFHKAMGFAQVGVIPKAGYKFGRFMDLVLMQKIL